MRPKKSTQGTAAIANNAGGFSGEERAAMLERAQKLKAEARRGRGADAADGESDVLATIAALVRKAVG